MRARDDLAAAGPCHADWADWACGGHKCAGRRVAQEHSGRRPLSAAPGGRTNGLALPAENGLVLDQQIVEFASLHALDQSGDLSMGVDEGGAFGVA
jgi:hypothetical protein